ncbi:MAG: YeeE/YedE family protein [Burkholderiaceae bacterium]|nr:MAG: YeeE/YedE family protein [Burkholderiaceae bacterium]
MKTLISFFLGLLFGIGLIVAGMSNPAKVLGFLDLAGRWDPSLAFVMMGAIGIASLPFYFLRRRQTAWLGEDLGWPTLKHIDRRLVIGSLLFGIGWGLAGVCPGPALVLLGYGSAKGLGFVLAMIVGFLICDRCAPRD